VVAGIEVASGEGREAEGRIEQTIGSVLVTERGLRAVVVIITQLNKPMACVVE